MASAHRRKVGAVRPSHLMYTSGVGSLVDLPNFSVLVRGLEDWKVDPHATVEEPRLLAAVRSVLGQSVEKLHLAPWEPDDGEDPGGPASRVGVPTIPFPAWLRCTACNELAPTGSEIFRFENDNAWRPQDARFVHPNCTRKRGGKPLAVAARFVLACIAGHLDDFPYTEFVHKGLACPKAEQPRLRMEDRGGNLSANVRIRCVNCDTNRSIRDALGRNAVHHLPACRGRHPHLGTFESKGCKEEPKTLVVGASNQWFAQTLAALAVPRTEASELDTKVEQHWRMISGLEPRMYSFARENVPAFAELRGSDDEIAAAVERVRERMDGDEPADSGRYPDLRRAEWEIFAADDPPEPGDDFALRRVDVPESLAGHFAAVSQVERLREVRALIGFTRLDAPDPDDPDLVIRAPLSRAPSPSWVHATEVRGEGIFLRFSEDLLTRWEKQVDASAALAEHCEAYGRFRDNRYSGRLPGDYQRMQHWPGARFIALHTLSHLLIRAIALDCGYSSASLAERIYAGTPDEPRGGILVYTAVPDAEGTLGGLVSLAEPDALERITTQALHGALHCSSDPLCAERLPHYPADFLHGAACHVCLFVSETTCERGNRFLDRRFVVPIDGDPGLALFPEIR